MKREEITASIALLECMSDIATAIEDVQSDEREPGDDGLFRITVTENDRNRLEIAFVHGLPPEVLLAGLRAMDAALDLAVRRLQGEAE